MKRNIATMAFCLCAAWSWAQTYQQTENGIKTSIPGKQVDVEGILGLRMVLVKVVPGLKGVCEGGRALGVDGDVDEIGISFRPGRFKALSKHIGIELGVGGDLGGGQEHIKKLVRGKVYAVFIFLIPHGDGEREHLDGPLFPQLGGQVCSGIGGELDTSHN